MSSGYIKLKKQRAKAKKLKEEQAQAKTRQQKEEALAERARQLAQRQANTQKKLDVIRKEKAVESAKRLLLRNILLPSIPSPSTRALKTSDGASPSKSPTRLLRTSDGGYYTGETDEKSRRDGYGCRYYKNGALLYRGSYKVTGREKKKSLLWLVVVVLTFGCLCCGGCCVGCCVGCVGSLFWFVIFGSLVVFRGHDFTATEKDTPWMEEKCFKETTPTVNLPGWDEVGVKTENRTKAPGKMVNPTAKEKCTTEIPARYSILGRW
jgi:hypothetical protein